MLGFITYEQLLHYYDKVDILGNVHSLMPLHFLLTHKPQIHESKRNVSFILPTKNDTHKIK